MKMGIVNKIRRQVSKINWFIKNHKYLTTDSRLVPSSYTYFADGLIVLNNSDCLIEEKFKKAYEKSLTVNDWRGLDGTKFDMRWRYSIVCWLANHVKRLDGDFVECGVYKGGYTMAIMDYIDFGNLDKRFWLLDTYEGLSFDHLTEKEKSSGLYEEYEHYEDSYEWVKFLFKDLNVNIIKGTVPETLPECIAEKICYLSIDMNCVEPEIKAVNYFWNKIVLGGVIILDDYGFNAHVEQKLAFDQFAKEKNTTILQLPTGQGVIFKN